MLTTVFEREDDTTLRSDNVRAMWEQHTDIYTDRQTELKYYVSDILTSFIHVSVYLLACKKW